MNADFGCGNVCQKPEDGSSARAGGTAAPRSDFPALALHVHGHPLVYLDNAATSQRPVSVVRAECEFYGSCNANVHRAIHFLGGEATERFEAARRRVADFIGAPSPRGVIFTSGTTAGVNLVAAGWGRKFLRSGDALLLTEMEHHSNLVPWQRIARERGAELRFIAVRPDGALDLETARRALADERVKLVAATWISNVLGTENPVSEIAGLAHAAGAVFFLDAAQGIPHRRARVAELGCDFLAFSGHKALAPTGVGALWGREDLLEAMDPFMGGGDMIERVTLETATWAELPRKFEAGTPHIAGAIGLGAAVDYLERIGFEAIAEHDAALDGRLRERLSEVPGVRLFGGATPRIAIVSFDVEGVHPHDLAQFLDSRGVAIRAGHLCAQPLMRRLGVGAVNRISPNIYNTADEIDAAVEAVVAARRYFGVHG